MKINKCVSVTLTVAFLFLSLVSGNYLFAASPAKQLEKGKALFAQNKDNEAMDYFIDVMVNGSKKEVDEANYYVNLIHNRLGGIQTPVEVDVTFKEGEVKRLPEGTDPSVLAAQQAAVMDTAATPEEAARLAAEERAAAARETAAEKATVAEEVAGNDLPYTAQRDLNAIDSQTQAVDAAAAGTAGVSYTQGDNVDPNQPVAVDPDSIYQNDEMLTTAGSSTFTDLTSPEALQARAVYTQQKLQSMTDAAIAKIRDTKGVRIYFRNGLPDAIDMDGDVVFQGNKFKPEALPLLDEIYSLMALTQGASYVILPPGSYTDDVSLPGIRQAMALNSFFVHKGISSGKISYNMGLYDQEPPAKFANLEGLSIVFDYDSELPAQIAQANSVSKAPLLSMAVVPVSNEIDPAAGEAFAVDFSVIETVNPIDNWVLQIVQHAKDGKYYVVRQLEGFAPVYHQIVWNGRKGIIGPELQCGKYTLVLTVTDLKGEKKTLRRSVDVKCNAKADAASAEANNICPKCNYKTARLWTKPGRTMKAVSAPKAAPAPAAAQPEFEDPLDALPDTLSAQDPYAMPEQTGSAAYPTQPAAGYPSGDGTAYPTQPAAAYPSQTGTPVDNPYDMPYDDYNAQ